MMGNVCFPCELWSSAVVTVLETALLLPACLLELWRDRSGMNSVIAPRELSLVDGLGPKRKPAECADGAVTTARLRPIDRLRS